MKSQIRGRFHPWTDYELEAYLCDELEPGRRARLHEQLQSDAQLAEYLRQRSERARLFAVEYPLAFSAVQTTAEPRDRSRSKRGGRLAACLAVAAATFALWLSPVSSPQVRQAVLPAPGDVRIKGNGLHATLYVKRGDQVFEHVPDSWLERGDVVRLGLDDPHGGYLTVVGVDPDQALSVYYDAVAIGPGRTLTPDGLLLEDTRMDERWLIVVTRESIRASQIVDRWRTGALVGDRYTVLRVQTGPQ